MSKDTVADWSTTASENTDVGGINIGEGSDPRDLNDAAREMMAQLKASDTEVRGLIANPLDTTAALQAYTRPTGVTTIQTLGNATKGDGDGYRMHLSGRADGDGLCPQQP